ncbi:hypothetical protein LSAT2_020553 [Lamellibrachia satsuma]|nr:hypothetical protein LSAT2_020553 [Lamellibrachia satsuma]
MTQHADDIQPKLRNLCPKSPRERRKQHPASPVSHTNNNTDQWIMPRPKKRRKFAGNQYTGSLKKTKTSASEEKIQVTKKKSREHVVDGYRLVDVQNLLNFVSGFPCPICGGNGYAMTENIAGLRSTISFTCLKPDCSSTYRLQSQPDGESVNTRFQMAMFSIGRNRQQAVRLLVFNEGEGARVNVFELLCLKCGKYMLEMMQALDTKRVASATSQATKTSKVQRKQRRMSKTQEKDSVYQTGGF